MEPRIFSLYSYELEELAEHHLENCCLYGKEGTLCSKSTPRSCVKEMFLKAPFKSCHFCFGNQNWFTTKIPGVVQSLSSCWRTSCIYSSYRSFWRARNGMGEHSCLRYHGHHYPVLRTHSSWVLWAEDRKIWRRHSSKRVSPPLWPSRAEPAPRCAEWTN